MRYNLLSNVSVSKEFSRSPKGRGARVTSVRSKEARSQQFFSKRNLHSSANTSSLSQNKLKDVFYSSTATLIDDEKDFASHGFDNFNEGT